MNAYLKTFTLATIVAGAIVLAGCTATTETTPTAAPSATRSATPAPTETGAVPEGTAAGDVVDESVAVRLNNSLAGDKAYKLGDAYVFVPVDEPLPEAVAKAVTESVIAAAPGAGATTGDDMGAAAEKQMAALEAQGDATGHRIALVSHMMSWNDSTNSYEAVWAVSEPAKAAAYSSQADAVAAVEKWMNGDPNKTYIVVDYLN